MSLHISFHNHGLLEVRQINETLTTLEIYQSPDSDIGSRITLFFDTPVDVANFASRIARLALGANAGYKVESDDYERGLRVGYRVAQQEGVN